MESLHYLLMKAHAMMQRCIFAEAQKIGLSSGQPKVLDYLYSHEGSDQKTIAAYCEIEPATLASILLRMEQKQLIERRQEHSGEDCDNCDYDEEFYESEPFCPHLSLGTDERF